MPKSATQQQAAPDPPASQPPAPAPTAPQQAAPQPQQAAAPQPQQAAAPQPQQAAAPPPQQAAAPPPQQTGVPLQQVDAPEQRRTFGAAHPYPSRPGAVTIGPVTTRLTVTVPAGISGGDLVRVVAPDGSYHSIMVPPGLTAGQQFSVELLSVNESCEVYQLRVRAFSPAPAAAATTATPKPTADSPLPTRAQFELEAERQLRRETQAEALRQQSVRIPLPPLPQVRSRERPPLTRPSQTCPPQALEQTQIKRMADHAFFRDMVKRQRRCIEALMQQAEGATMRPS